MASRRVAEAPGCGAPRPLASGLSAPVSAAPALRAFGRDAPACAALRAGLGGLDARVDRLGFKGVLARLAHEEGPSGLLVDVEGAGVPPPEATRLLRGVLPRATGLVVVAPDEGPDSVRACYAAGAADFLPKPLSAAAVREAALALLDDPEGSLREHAGRVVACAGSAGLGLSSLAVTLAKAVAEAGRTVVCVDLDPVAGRGRRLTGTQPGPALDATLFRLEVELQGHDEARAAGAALGPELVRTEVDARLSDPVQPRLRLVSFPAPSGPPEEPPTGRSVQRLLDALANQAQVVLVLGLSEPDVLLPVLNAADARLVAYEPTLASLGYVTHLLPLLEVSHGTVLLECRVRRRAPSVTPGEVARVLAGRRPDVVIPFEPAFFRPRPPGRRYRRAVEAVVAAVIGLPAEVPPRS